MEFRIGINVGDIVVEDGDIFGDGVSIARRRSPGSAREMHLARVQEDVSAGSRHCGRRSWRAGVA
jgi:hypothetical protein